MSFDVTILRKRTHHLQKEIALILDKDLNVKQEIIGNFNTVSTPDQPTFHIIAHSHVEDKPPSQEDFIMMLKGKVLFGDLYHIVVSPTRVYQYKSSDPTLLQITDKIIESCQEDEYIILLRESLQEELQQLDSLVPPESTAIKEKIKSIQIQYCYLGEQNAIRDFNQSIKQITDPYLKHQNTKLYIDDLAKLGIEMIIY